MRTSAGQKRREPVASALTSAASAGLRYVTDDRPGIRREMGTLGFRYARADGRPVRSPADLRRIRALAIPPAWKDVWICPDPKGHVQATGRDARGRKQYRYHAEWRASRDGNKFDRLEAFASVLPVIRAGTAADMARPGLPREKVLATVVQLLEKSLIRVGNDEYAKANRSFGLTTLRDQHVDVKGSTLRFEFRGKSGKRHTIDLSDRRLARIVKQCRDLPGQDLFQYLDDDGQRQNVNSSDVNEYLRELAGTDVTAKDFRTWSGTLLAVTALRELSSADSTAAAKKNVVRAIEAVAGVLGNTPAVCRKSYIHPAIVECYLDRSMDEKLARSLPASVKKVASKLRPDEVAALRILHCMRPATHRRKAA
jgi:DNA topoisomerase-1